MRQGFLRARDGNVAMLFAILIVPLLVGVGVAIDGLRAHQVRSELAEATDAGVLAAARAKVLNPTMTDAAATVIARKYFDTNRRVNAQMELQSFTFSYNSATHVFRLQATGRVRTAMLGVIGQEWMPVNVVSEAKVAPPRVLEVALVLDNTQSMNGAKIAALKSAAHSLVDQVMTASTPTVKVGIVPFSQYVNVGLSRRNEPWIDVPADYTDSGTWCRNEYPNRTYSNCTTTTRTCTDNNDGSISTHSCTDTNCDVDDGAPVYTCSPYSNDHVWRGCVGSRNDPHDVQDIAWGGQHAPGLLDEWCPTEVTPLTNNKATVVAAIDAMSVQGNTYIPAGLFWGQALISADAPFTEGETYASVAAQSGLKAIVLMTDGMNTISATYPAHNGSDAAAANAKMSALCSEIKSKDVTIYTVAFQVTDPTIQALLNSCASKPSQSYDADNAAELDTAFLEIGRSLTELALTK